MTIKKWFSGWRKPAPQPLTVKSEIDLSLPEVMSVYPEAEKVMREVIECSSYTDYWERPQEEINAYKKDVILPLHQELVKTAGENPSDEAVTKQWKNAKRVMNIPYGDS